jgi:hypothetical protein
MERAHPANEPSVASLIAIPALISLAVTALRLAGELQHWSPRWFSSETGGVAPSGMSWLIGITWLALPFGAYFGFRLAAAGQGPESLRRAFLCVGAAMVLLIAWILEVIPAPNVGFPRVLIFIWLVMVIAAIIQLAGWPRLFKVLLAYGLVSRIPVAIIMFLAMRGNWGTHYDYVGMGPQFQMSLLPRYLWLAFFPQLVFWVAYTIVMGSLAGVITSGVLRVLRVRRVQGV